MKNQNINVQGLELTPIIDWKYLGTDENHVITYRKSVRHWEDDKARALGDLWMRTLPPLPDAPEEVHEKYRKNRNTSMQFFDARVQYLGRLVEIAGYETPGPVIVRSNDWRTQNI